MRAAAALALATLVLLALALELASRVFVPELRTHVREPLVFDAELGFRGQPGARLEGFDARGPFAVRFGADGLRLRERAAAGNASPLREIALLGDSFVVARAVRDDDTLSAQLEADLAERGRPARVRDLAVIDYGTAQQLLWLRERAADARFDTLVLALYPGNDFANNTLALAGRTTVSPGDTLRPYLVPRRHGGFERRYAHPWRAALRGGSHAFAVLEQKLMAFGAARGIGWLAPRQAPGTPAERLAAGRLPREELELHREPAPDSAWAEAWSTTERLLIALRDEARARDARFVVLVIPGAQEVQEEAMNVRLDLLARRHAGRGIRELIDWNLPERRLAELLARDEIEALLLLDDFRAAAARGDALYLPDGHFTASGHALAASLLAGALARDPPLRALPPASREPAPLLPAPEQAPAMLDFRRASHESYLVRGGWLIHRSSGSAPGWIPAAHACLVLPARRGDLVLRGRVPGGVALPIVARMRLDTREQRIVLARPGAFVLRIPAPLAADEPRWTEVNLDFAGATSDARRPTELAIESVGFEGR